MRNVPGTGPAIGGLEPKVETVGIEPTQRSGQPYVERGPFITIADAAAWAEVSEAEIYRGIRNGEFELLRLGPRLLRLRERDVGAAFKLPLPGPREIELSKPAPKPPPKAKPKRAVDHWLYWFYDSDGLLLYIGITNTGVKRMEAHGAQKEWWPQVATIKVQHFPTRDEAEAAETEAIRTHLPVHNVRDSVRFRKGRLC